jgi:hypothetical protein
LGKLIGITGLAGGGKTTAANLLLSRAKDSCRIPLAEPIKQMCLALGLTEEMVYGDRKGTPVPGLGDITPRRIMQTLGTDWGRKMIHQDLWVLPWRVSVRRAFEDGHKLVVCDDVRFHNEVRFIKRMGGKVIRVSSDRVQQTGHESESYITELDVDAEIENNGSLEELSDRIVTTAKEVLSS